MLAKIDRSAADGASATAEPEQDAVQIETESFKMEHILGSLYGISTIFHKIGEMAELQRIMVERYRPE